MLSINKLIFIVFNYVPFVNYIIICNFLYLEDSQDQVGGQGGGVVLLGTSLSMTLGIGGNPEASRLGLCHRDGSGRLYVGEKRWQHGFCVSRMHLLVANFSSTRKMALPTQQALEAIMTRAQLLPGLVV